MDSRKNATTGFPYDDLASAGVVVVEGKSEVILLGVVADDSLGRRSASSMTSRPRRVRSNRRVTQI
jgi:hypothetical protein